MHIKDFILNFKVSNRKDSQLMHVNILNRLHSNLETITLGFGTFNINHDLHEILFHLWIYQLYINKIYKNKNNFEIQLIIIWKNGLYIY